MDRHILTTGQSCWVAYVRGIRRGDLDLSIMVAYFPRFASGRYDNLSALLPGFTRAFAFVASYSIFAKGIAVLLAMMPLLSLQTHLVKGRAVSHAGQVVSDASGV